MIGRTLKYLSTSIAQRHRKTFLKKFRYEWLNEIKKQINIQVISFSGKKQFADQLYSLTSFYRNVGRPISWNIYSDGSYTSSEIEIFSLIRGVKVSDVNIKKSNIPENYFKKYPTLLKVEILKQFQSHSDTIVFSDSDILFYPKFSEFLDIFQEANWYLVDEGTGYFEPGYKLPQGQQPLNLGLLVLNKPINIDYVILYIAKKINQGSLHYWSDQIRCGASIKTARLWVWPCGHPIFGAGTLLYQKGAPYSLLPVNLWLPTNAPHTPTGHIHGQTYIPAVRGRRNPWAALKCRGPLLIVSSQFGF